MPWTGFGICAGAARPGLGVQASALPQSGAEVERSPSVRIGRGKVQSGLRLPGLRFRADQMGGPVPRLRGLEHAQPVRRGGGRARPRRCAPRRLCRRGGRAADAGPDRPGGSAALLHRLQRVRPRARRRRGAGLGEPGRRPARCGQEHAAAAGDVRAVAADGDALRYRRGVAAAGGAARAPPRAAHRQAEDARRDQRGIHPGHGGQARAARDGDRLGAGGALRGRALGARRRGAGARERGAVHALRQGRRGGDVPGRSRHQGRHARGPQGAGAHHRLLDHARG